MSTHMLTLHSDCVQLIFDRIPTHHLLLHVGRVCHAWQHHQQLNCRARKSLIILQGTQAFYAITQNKFNEPFREHNITEPNSSKNKFFMNHHKIAISPKKSPNVQFLVSNFPHLHTLVVSTQRIESQNLRSFTQLIASYSFKLVTLGLYFDGKIKNGTQNLINSFMGSLLNQLNLLSSLKHITIHAQLLFANLKTSRGLSINPQIEEPEYLTRIKEFHFYFENVDKVMLDWLRKYDKTGRLNQLTRIYLSIYPDSTHLPPYNQFDHYPLSNLYYIVPYCHFLFEENEEQLKQIVARFSSLTTITYTLKSSITSLSKLASILSPLTKLVHAELIIECVPTNKQLNLDSVDQLASIKALDLMFSFASSSHYYKLAKFFQSQSQSAIIAHIFPHLQSIRIVNLESYISDEANEASQKLVKQFLANLGRAYGTGSLRTEYLHCHMSR